MTDDSKQKLPGHKELPFVSATEFFGALLTVRNTELQAYYSRYNIMAGISAGLLAAVWSQGAPQLHHAVVGTLFCLVWGWMVIRGKYLLMESWDARVARFEEEVLCKINVPWDAEHWRLLSRKPHPAWTWKGLFRVISAPLTLAGLMGPAVTVFGWWVSLDLQAVSAAPLSRIVRLSLWFAAALALAVVVVGIGHTLREISAVKRRVTGLEETLKSTQNRAG